MVFSSIGDPLQKWSVKRCPRSEGCLSRLCPLDPYLKQATPEPPVRLCYWYEISGKPSAFDEIPLFLWRPLLVYTLYLLETHLLTLDRHKNPHSGLPGCPRTGLFNPAGG